MMLQFLIDLLKCIKSTWQLKKDENKNVTTPISPPQSKPSKRKYTRRKPPKKRQSKKTIKDVGKAATILLLLFPLFSGCSKKSKHPLNNQVVKTTLHLLVRKPIIDEDGNHKILIYNAGDYENKNG